MLFNSFDFGFFLVIVYAVYWLIGVRRKNLQNVLLLIASYTFYGLWDWRFLGLLIASSLIDFYAAKAIHSAKQKKTQRIFLFGSVFWNLGILMAFKYFDFFIDSFESLFNVESVGFSTLNIIIPVGLSFYTFQTMSYTIDVYRGKTRPTASLLNFLGFVSFFPQLVAGPIERASKLLPQFETERKFNLQQAKEGLRQILWGLFKKVLVADKLGVAVTVVFSEPEAYGTLMLCYAAVLFSFQMYCDFSGYTDIAIGTAKLFGFNLSQNFKLPYFAKSITNFWQRWHITLTKWFTDYVYVPFVRSFKTIKTRQRVVGLLLTMLLVGLWHGANWTFIVFGLFNGLVLIIERIPFFKNKQTLAKKMLSAPRVLALIYFFTITSISSVFFRSDSISEAFLILKRIFSFTPDTHIGPLIGTKIFYLAVLLIAEILTRRRDFPLQKLELTTPKPIRWVLYYTLIFFIIRYAEPREAFLYFQF